MHLYALVLMLVDDRTEVVHPTSALFPFLAVMPVNQASISILALLRRKSEEDDITCIPAKKN